MYTQQWLLSSLRSWEKHAQGIIKGACSKSGPQSSEYPFGYSDEPTVLRSSPEMREHLKWVSLCCVSRQCPHSDPFMIFWEGFNRMKGGF